MSDRPRAAAADGGGRSPPGEPRAEWTLELDLSRLGRRELEPLLGDGAPGVSVDGYVIGPNGELTVAVALDGDGDPGRYDRVWESMERTGLARRRYHYLDERGRTVIVLTLPKPLDGRWRHLLTEFILIPVQERSGRAELQVVATALEVQELEQQLRAARVAVDGTSQTGLPIPGPSPLSNEDWAFLGLLEATGPLPRPGERDLIEARFGLDPVRFDAHLQAVERGLKDLVTDLFETPGRGANA